MAKTSLSSQQKRMPPPGTAKGVRLGGRRKGTPNKIPAEVKMLVRQALEELGGVEYLKRVAIDHPVAFVSLLSKLIPAEAHIEAAQGKGNGAPVMIQIVTGVPQGSD